MAEQNSMPHRLSLNERKELTVTAVAEVVSFDEETVVLRTNLGTLFVQGRELQLKELSPEGGQVRVTGSISSLVYQEPKSTGGFFRRLLG
jgi:sporulation protein YabP